MLCCPGTRQGVLRVQLGSDDGDSRVIDAHSKELSCIAVNSSGTLVATASMHGTVVKVWSTQSGQNLYRLRRSMRQAVVTSIAFREDDRFLALTSDSLTVHLFRLEGDCASSRADNSRSGESLDASDRGCSGYATSEVCTAQQGVAADVVNDAVGVVKGVVIPNYFVDQKSFAQFRIPGLEAAGQNAVDVRARNSNIQGPKVGFRGKEPVLLVLHYSGVLYEVTFREDTPITAAGGVGGAFETQELSCTVSHMYFASRPDFRVHELSAELVADEGCDGDDNAEAWQLL